MPTGTIFCAPTASLRGKEIRPSGVLVVRLPSNTRKTELPSAALTRVFLARLGGADWRPLRF